MASRLLAGLILFVGVGVLAFVLLGRNDTSSVATEPAEVQPDVTDSTTTTIEEFPMPENYGPRMDLVNLDGWLNTEAQSIDEFNGKVLVVEMWTFGCFNCKNRIPHTQELYAAHSRDDVEIIGVHAPEFDREAVIENIVAAVDDLGVTWPVALDTDKTNFRAWQDGGRRFWPRTYVIDQNGDVRYDHIGEGRYQELAATVQYLVDNPPAPTS